ncbi:hypothetical protein GGR54DRAFT_298879 [Hypoxylon sp. NC1633]|nr:hypothetical protein GGR54DRAFT_298879 [Hypoxylon sp. NC1633]
MNVQFFTTYKPRFEELVAAHYAMAEQPRISTAPGLLGNIIASNPDDLSDALVLEAHTGTSNLGEAASVAKDGLVESLWTRLLLSFEVTASMDAPERSEAIAKSLRPIVLDNKSFDRDPDLAVRLEAFTEAVRSSLLDVWCSNREAYITHGDATHLLAKVSRAKHTYLRRTLKVPMMATKVLLTPSTNELGLGLHGAQAPTVGSYNGAVYRALRDGTLIRVAIHLLDTCV